MQKLLIAYKVPPYFLDALYAFGAKITGDDDPHFNLCKNNPLSLDGKVDNESYEICYLLRAYERHGRPGLKNPWSLRQALVYQKYNNRARTSVWIFIQLFKRSKGILWDEISRQDCIHHPVNLHAILLGTALSDWRWFLNDQRRLIESYREKALHSSLATHLVDYEVTFLDCQRVERLVDALSLSQGILRSIKEIASMLQSWITSNSPDWSAAEIRCREFMQIPEYSRRIHEHIAQSALMQTRAERTSLLLQKLLDYRNIGIANSNTRKLTQIGAAARSQRDNLKDILLNFGVDSRFMKVLTFIATLYLPANLLAGIFSSDLVHVPSTALESNTGVLHIRKAMWIYVLLSLLLTGSTFTATFIYEGRGRFTAGRRVIAGEAP